MLVCTKFSCMIIFGIVLTIAGGIMTMYGLFAKPFWGENRSWCDFCMEERETTLRNTRNCRIAGPVLIGIGVLLIVIGAIIRKKTENNNLMSRGGVMTYNATGLLGGEPVQGGYPATKITNYSTNTGGYPASAQQAPYPPQQQGRYPQQQQAPYPPQQPAGRYPQPGAYQQQPGAYPSQPDAVPYNSQQPEKSGYPPPSDFGVAPPSYNEALATPSAPQQ